MLASIFVLASALALPALAAPSVVKREFAPYVADVEIHESCNATERRQLTKALSDTMEVAQLAKNYLVANGPTDEVYKLYFGDGNWLTAMGAFDGILNSNKEGVLLRCDNIDGNCGQEGWAGHWRGTNGTLETVICPLSYEIRKYNEQWCALGYTVAGSSPSYYFATDLIHRFFHVPTISNSLVSHYADTYQECLELAKTNGTEAVMNTHTLQYFASHIYANEKAAPGVGCTGEAPAEEASSHAAPASSAPAAASGTASAAQSCHTHAGGELHCV